MNDSGKSITLLDDRQWPTAGFSFMLPIRRKSAALGVIDVQGYGIDSDGHLAGTVREHHPQEPVLEMRVNRLVFKGNR